MKQAIPTYQMTHGGTALFVNVPAAPWGEIPIDTRPETAPRRKGLIATPRIADQFIAALREAHRSQQ